MKRLILAVLVLICIIVVLCVSYFRIFEICDRIYFFLEKSEIDEAYSTWKESKDYLSFFINRRLIENIDSEAANMVTCENMGNNEESEKERIKFMNDVSELKEFERPSFSNIFSVDIFM